MCIRESLKMSQDEYLTSNFHIHISASFGAKFLGSCMRGDCKHALCIGAQ